MRIGVAFLAGALSLAAKSYPVDGIVVALDPSARTMLVAHRPIANYMGAMTMPFRVREARDLAGLSPGSRVEFELVVSRDQSFARAIRQTGRAVEIGAPKERLRIGDRLPEVSLTDQSGRALRLSDLRGKVVAVNFLYTRCPLPDVCPRLAANFAALQRRIGDPDLVLLSITVDPEFDTPAVLADYAKRWGAGPRWRFLTGGVAPIAAALGELYWTDEGSIGHNSATAIVDRQGRIAAFLEGSSYRVDQLASLVSHELEKPQ